MAEYVVVRTNSRIAPPQYRSDKTLPIAVVFTNVSTAQMCAEAWQTTIPEGNYKVFRLELMDTE